MKFTEFLKIKNLYEEFNRSGSKYGYYITIDENIRNEYNLTSLEELDIDDYNLIYHLLERSEMTRGMTVNAFLSDLKRKVMRENKVSDAEKRILLESGKVTKDYFDEILVKSRESIEENIKKDKNVFTYGNQGVINNKIMNISFDVLFSYISKSITRENLDNLNGIRNIMLYVPTVISYIMNSIRNPIDLLNSYINLEAVICNVKTSILSALIYLRISDDIQSLRKKYASYGITPKIRYDKAKQEIINQKMKSKEDLNEDEIDYLKAQFCSKSENGILFTDDSLNNMENEDKELLFKSYEFFKLFSIDVNETLSKNKLNHVYRLLVTFILHYITLQRGFDPENKDYLPPTIRHTLPNDLRNYNESEIAQYFYEKSLKNVKLPSLLKFWMNNIPGALRNRALRINLGNRAKRFATLAFDDGLLDLDLLQPIDKAMIKFLILCDKLGLLVYNMEAHKHSETIHKEKIFKYSRKIWTLITIASGKRSRSGLEEFYRNVSSLHPNANYNKTAQINNLFDMQDHLINPTSNNVWKEGDSIFTSDDLKYWISRYIFQLNWKCYYYNEFGHDLDEILCKGSGLNYFSNMLNFNNQIWETSTNKDKEKLIEYNNKIHYYVEAKEEDTNKMIETLNALDLTKVEVIKHDFTNETQLLDNLTLEKPNVHCFNERFKKILTEEIPINERNNGGFTKSSETQSRKENPKLKSTENKNVTENPKVSKNQQEINNESGKTNENERINQNDIKTNIKIDSHTNDYHNDNEKTEKDGLNNTKKEVKSDDGHISDNTFEKDLKSKSNSVNNKEELKSEEFSSPNDIKSEFSFEEYATSKKDEDSSDEFF